MPVRTIRTPQAFQGKMNFYLGKFLGKAVIAYPNDILILSETLNEHLLLFNHNFTRLKCNCSFSKFPMCGFAVWKQDILGHHISDRRVKPQSLHLEAMRQWSAKLRNVDKMRKLLGVGN